MMLMDVTGLELSDIHLAQRRGDKKLNAVNIDVKQDAATGEGGVLPSAWGTCLKQRDVPLPVPTITLGPIAFQSGGPQGLIRTLVHEATHHLHAVKLIQLMERFRETTSDNFHEFHRRYKRSGKISSLEFQLFDVVKGAVEMTQILAHLVGFVASYHQVNFYERGDLGRFPFWDLLRIAANNVERHHDASRYVIDRLRQYFSGLEFPHRDELKRFLSDVAQDNDFFQKLRQALDPPR